MTPEDKKAAREAIERGRLTVEQVQALMAETAKTGRPFAALAREKGLLPPEPPPLPPSQPPPAPARPLLPRKPMFYSALMGASLLIFAGLLVATMLYRFDKTQKDRQHDIESQESRVASEQAAQEANKAYHRRRIAQKDAEARAALDRARETLAWIDDRIAKDPSDPTLHDRAVEATIALNLYLDSFPGDAPALVLRSRSWELRRNYDYGLRDLERALVLQPALEPEVRKRLDLLRKLNAKPVLR